VIRGLYVHARLRNLEPAALAGLDRVPAKEIVHQEKLVSWTNKFWRISLLHLVSSSVFHRPASFELPCWMQELNNKF
jgi:hypothetical protein